MADPRAKLTLPRDEVLAEYHDLGARGIEYPVATVREARLAHLILSVACALLEKETGGGDNVFGHDPVKAGQIKGGPVTRERYRRYKAMRKQGLGMQGVGPTQLTWWAFQDQADKLGGCWRPSVNMHIGFVLLAGYLEDTGSLAKAGERYNGAAAYGADLVKVTAKWRARFDHDRKTKPMPNQEVPQ